MSIRLTRESYVGAYPSRKTGIHFSGICALLRSGLAAGALLAASGLAHAQATLLPELLVVSPSLVPIEASKTGSSVTEISGEEARNSGFSQLSDVMRTFPGMHVSQSGTRGTLTQFRVRGGEANHLLVMIDGVAVNAVGDGEFNFADIPMDDIERVELLRGPQSGLYGANAQTGVLTIVTRSGRGLTKPEFNARFEGGTQNSADGAMSARGAAGPIYGAVTASYGTTNGFNIARTGSENDGAKRFVVTAKAGVDFSPNFNVEGFVRSTRRVADTDPQSFVTGLVFDRAFDQSRYDDTIARVEGTLKLFDDRWIQSIKATSTLQHVSAFDATTPSPGLSSASQGSAETFSYKSALLLDSMIAGGERHRITGLVENRNERFSFFSSFLFGPDLAAAQNGYTRTSTGIGGEYILDLLATGTTISTALRQDFNEPFQDEFTYRFSVSQKVAPIGGRAHASVGRGVTNPSFIEQFGFLTSTFLPNPNLVPESSIGWDAGWEQTFWSGRFIVDVTYFNMRLQNEIVTVFLPPPISKTSVANLTGTSTREGVETTAKLRPADWLILSGTYTFTEARDDKGVQEIRRPRHAASGSATVLFDGGRGKATINVVYNGKMPDTWFKFPTETVILDAYTLVGGQISYDTTPWSTIYLRAENVFNRRYEEVFSYRSPGAAVYAGLKVRSN
jgi:vitamin B12 transporter